MSGPRLLRLRTDDQLVALFRMGYDEAFGAIHDRYRQRLLAYTRRMLSRSGLDAEDVLQDTFLRAYSALRHDDRPVTLRAWLYRVAHNRCIDHLRRPEPPMAEIFELQRGLTHDPPLEALRREDLRRLVDDVQRLPEQQRSALLMRELEGLTYAELADALGTSVPAVKSLLVRARCGLVDAGEARDAACPEIRADLDDSLGRGVRASARSRRHLRDCAPCREYRVAARRTRHGLRALSPGGGPLAALAKLIGLGGAGSAAGAGAGGSAAVIGTGATATATKLVAVVCAAAVVGGGAVEVEHHTKSTVRHGAHGAAGARGQSHAIAAQPVSPVRAALAADPAHRGATARHKRTPAVDVAPIRSALPEEPPPAPAASPAVEDQAARSTAAQTGGALAPDEDAAPAPPAGSAPAPGTSTATGATASPSPAPAGPASATLSTG